MFLMLKSWMFVIHNFPRVNVNFKFSDSIGGLMYGTMTTSLSYIFIKWVGNRTWFLFRHTQHRTPYRHAEHQKRFDFLLLKIVPHTFSDWSYLLFVFTKSLVKTQNIDRSSCHNFMKIVTNWRLVKRNIFWSLTGIVISVVVTKLI